MVAFLVKRRFPGLSLYSFVWFLLYWGSFIPFQFLTYSFFLVGGGGGEQCCIKFLRMFYFIFY
jgi:hypothetical protein